MEAEPTERTTIVPDGSPQQPLLTYYSESLSHDELSSILSNPQNTQFEADARTPLKGNLAAAYAPLKPQEAFNLAVAEYVAQSEDGSHEVNGGHEVPSSRSHDAMSVSPESNLETGENSVADVIEKTVLTTNAMEMITDSTSMTGNGRRLLLLDEEVGDLDMTKTDVEYLLRSDAAGILLKQDKNKKSEVWARFGKIEFEGRRVKGFVACIYCRQVYAFGDKSSHTRRSNSTSALKKHRCPVCPSTTSFAGSTERSFVNNTPNGASTPSKRAASAVASSSVSNIGGSNGVSVFLNSGTSATEIPVLISLSPEDRENESASNGELPSSPLEQPETERISSSSNVPPPVLNISSCDRDEFCKQLVLLSAQLGIVPSQVASLSNLARFLIVLGVQHSSGAVADIQAVLKSHAFQGTILTTLATTCRTRLLEELRTGSGLALSLQVLSKSQDAAGCQVILQAHSLISKAIVPLGVARLTAEQKRTHLRKWLLETLLSHRLENLRRIIACNDAEVVSEDLPGEQVVLCALTDLERLLEAIFTQANAKFKQLLATVEELAFCAQVAPSADHKRDKGLYYLNPLWRLQTFEMFDIVAQLPSATVERWAQIRTDTNEGVTLDLDRRMLSDVIAFVAPFREYLRKLDTSAPTLHLPLLFRLQLLSHCQNKPHENDFVAHLKAVTRKILDHDLQSHLLHRMACALHPAFKLLKKVSIADTEKISTYDAVRLYIRNPDNTSAPNQSVAQPVELGSKETRRRGRSAMEAPPPKRQRANPPVFGEFGEFWDLSVSEENGGFTLSDKDELDLYLEESLSVQDLQFSQVMNYWEGRKSTLGKLSKVAKWILTLPAVCSTLPASLMTQLEQNGDAQLVLNYESILAGNKAGAI